MVPGWLIKLAAVVGVLGVVGFDAASIGITHLTLDDRASQAAVQAQHTWSETRNVRRSYDSAVATAQRSDPDVSVPARGYRVEPDGTVTVTLVRTARTLIARRIPATREYTVIRATGSAHEPDGD